jgi:hypothetical protein
MKNSFVRGVQRPDVAGPLSVPRRQSTAPLRTDDRVEHTAVTTEDEISDAPYQRQ